MKHSSAVLIAVLLVITIGCGDNPEEISYGPQEGPWSGNYDISFDYYSGTISDFYIKTPVSGGETSFTMAWQGGPANVTGSSFTLAGSYQEGDVSLTVTIHGYFQGPTSCTGDWECVGNIGVDVVHGEDDWSASPNN